MEILIGLGLAGSIAVAAWWLVRSAFALDQRTLKNYTAKPKTIAEQDLYGIEARQKVLAERRKGNREELKQWDITFTQTIQNACPHKYDMHAYKWYECTECAYEEPWHWDYACTCWSRMMPSCNGRYDEYLLQRRLSTCNIHGRDWEQYKKEATDAFNQQVEAKLALHKAMNEIKATYSKGGIIN